jgi:hypothetical protein
MHEELQWVVHLSSAMFVCDVCLELAPAKSGCQDACNIVRQKRVGVVLQTNTVEYWTGTSYVDRTAILRIP